MAVFLAWSDYPVDVSTPGPWRELRTATPSMLLVDSDQSLSRVYHELKWSLPDEAALFVAPLGAVPKLKHLPAGTLSWLRARLT